MEITVNGVRADAPEGQPLVSLLAEHTGRSLDEAGVPSDGRPLPVAVALNGAVLRRAQWRDVVLAAGDHVDVVTAVQGG